MEIKRLGEHKIRCALTEEEILDMGYNIDEIIGNAETTQRFMRNIVEIVEEQEHINMENFSPMVRAELLPDHSMAITFGGDNELSMKELVDTVGQLMSQLAPEKLEQFKDLDQQEKKTMVDDFLSKLGNEKKQGKAQTKEEAEEAEQTTGQEEKQVFYESMPFGLEFSDMDDVIGLCRRFSFTGNIPASSLYRYRDQYYLMMDFIHFTRDELRPMAFVIVEYNNHRFAEASRIAFIKEHGKCIVENEALQTLMQL